MSWIKFIQFLFYKFFILCMRYHTRYCTMFFFYIKQEIFKNYFSGTNYEEEETEDAVDEMGIVEREGEEDGVNGAYN